MKLYRLVLSSLLLQMAKSNLVSNKVQHLIIGGERAVPKQFHYPVAIFYNDVYICTGSIIGRYTVLTAAHCVVFFGTTVPTDTIHAIANVNKSAPGYRITFSNVIPHPDYNEVNNDIAVLKTSQEIPFNKEIQPVCIAKPNTFRLLDKLTVAMGWGQTERRNDSTPDILHYVKQKIVPNFLCMFVNEYITDSNICAAGPSTGICSGDSGGPLVYDLIKPAVQVGVAAYINGDFGCGTFVPAVFTCVRCYYDFIMTSANDNTICVAK